MGQVPAPTPRVAAEAQVHVAYLLSRYPAVSHTFLLHEVLGLRRLGIEIDCASINSPDRELNNLPPLEADEAQRTFYVKATGVGSAAFALLETLVLRPAVIARGVRAVFSVKRCTLRQRGYWLFYLVEAILVGRWMRQRSLDHLHVHFGGPVASVGMLTAAAWKLPYSLTIHGPEELLDVSAYHLREKISTAQFVVCISDFCRSQLLAISPPESWHEFLTVRLGIDPEALLPRPTAPPRAIPELVCTGRLVAEKGHRILLDALLLLRQQGISLHATFVGDGPERPALESFIAEHSLGDSVTLLGALPHSAALERVRDADIFALASFAEGVPVALMEAMAFEVPCVSTTVAGIPELIRSGVDGILVPPANAAALAEALSRLAADPELRSSIGASARERVKAAYNLGSNHQTLAGIFKNRIGIAQPVASQPVASRTAP
ncbi:MAG: glycosyltransferase [Acidobacteriaceae bacterium]